MKNLVSILKMHFKAPLKFKLKFRHFLLLAFVSCQSSKKIERIEELQITKLPFSFPDQQKTTPQGNNLPSKVNFDRKLILHPKSIPAIFTCAVASIMHKTL